MERSQLFDLMGELKLYGMKAAFDEIMTTAVKRQHEPQRIVGDLLNAEINEKQARSIKYQLTIAKLPLAKGLDDFQFDGTTLNLDRSAMILEAVAGGLRDRPLKLCAARLRSAVVIRFYILGRSVTLATSRKSRRQCRIWVLVVSKRFSGTSVFWRSGNASHFRL